MLVNKVKKLSTADSIHSYTIRLQILATGKVDLKDLECGKTIILNVPKHLRDKESLRDKPRSGRPHSEAVV